MEVNTMYNLAIFISGQGSNALKISEYFKSHPTIKIACLVSNNLSWKNDAIQNVFYLHSKDELSKESLIQFLKSHKVSHIILAGFLWKISENLLKHYTNRIINIHPSLLPKFGGKGMYGIHVHRAVINSGDKNSGFTVHKVNEEYDKGDIIFQHMIPILANETAESLQEKVKNAENKMYPGIIENFVLSTL